MSAEKWANFEFEQGRRTVPATSYFSHLPKQSRITKHRSQHRPSEFCGGHRGSTHPPWGCGPREPPFPRAGGCYGGIYTVFIDGISSSATNGDLWKLCENFGTVVDTFISRKHRKNNNLAFGFVRYKNGDYAVKAIRHLDGQTFFGLKIKVSLAKYDKGGRPFPQDHNEGRKMTRTFGPITSPALRDNRRYSDVLLGRAKPVYTTVNSDRVSKENEKDNKTQVSLIIHENPVMVNRLNQAIVVELKQPYEVKDLESILSENDMDSVCISALSPFKVALFFDDEPSLMLALEADSPLRRAFVDVHRWSDKEQYNERLAWLECVGVNPKCWGPDNFKKIGGLWGETVEVEHRVNGVNSLTSAKILVRTTFMEKIDTYVKLSWESGSCDIRIYEFQNSSTELPVDSLATNKYFREETNRNFEGEMEAAHYIGEEVSVHVNDEQEDGLELLMDRNLLLMNLEGSTSEDRNIYGNEQLNKCEEGKGVAIGVEREEAIAHGTASEHITKPREDGDGIGSEPYNVVVGDQQLIHSIEGKGDTVCVGPEVADAHVEANGHGTKSMVEGKHMCSEQQPIRQHEHCFENESVAFFVSCTEALYCSPRFDPMASIECSLNRTEARTQEQDGSYSKSATDIKTKKRRGRPKRLAFSLPDPLYVPSTPSKSCGEAVETWNIAKSLGIKAADDGAVVSALRKSKRLLSLEARNPGLG